MASEEPLSDDGFVVLNASDNNAQPCGPDGRPQLCLNSDQQNVSTDSVDVSESPSRTVRRPSGASGDSSSSDEAVEQWRRSIVVSDVPEDMTDMLQMGLELKKRGGGTIETFERNPTSRNVLVIFHEAEVAERFLNLGAIEILHSRMPVTKPQLVNDPQESIPYCSRDTSFTGSLHPVVKDNDGMVPADVSVKDGTDSIETLTDNTATTDSGVEDSGDIDRNRNSLVGDDQPDDCKGDQINHGEVNVAVGAKGSLDEAVDRKDEDEMVGKDSGGRDDLKEMVDGSKEDQVDGGGKTDDKMTDGSKQDENKEVDGSKVGGKVVDGSKEDQDKNKVELDGSVEGAGDKQNQNGSVDGGEEEDSAKAVDKDKDDGSENLENKDMVVDVDKKSDGDKDKADASFGKEDVDKVVDIDSTVDKDKVDGSVGTEDTDKVVDGGSVDKDMVDGSVSKEDTDKVVDAGKESVDDKDKVDGSTGKEDKIIDSKTESDEERTSDSSQLYATGDESSFVMEEQTSTETKQTLDETDVDIQITDKMAEITPQKVEDGSVAVPSDVDPSASTVVDTSDMNEYDVVEAGDVDKCDREPADSVTDTDALSTLTDTGEQYKMSSCTEVDFEPSTLTSEPLGELGSQPDDTGSDAAGQTSEGTTELRKLNSDPEGFVDIVTESALSSTHQRLAAAGIAVSAVAENGRDEVSVSSEGGGRITLLVSGIPRGLQETAEMFLESKKKGGGKLDKFEYNDKTGSARVQFVDNKVAKSLLERKTLSIQGNQMSVSVAPDEEMEQLQRTIVVRGVNSDMEDVLNVLLETPKKGGGELETFSYNEETETVRACFVDVKVAESLLARGKISISGQEFVISAATNQLQNEEDLKWQRRTILVLKVPEKMEETLLMFLENKRKDGGPIETSKTHELSRTVMVTFVDEEVASRFIANGSIKIQKKTFTITAFTGPGRDFPESLEECRDDVSMSDSSSHISSPFDNLMNSSTSSMMSTSVFVETSTVPEQQVYTTIEVSNIPPGTDTKTLTMIFESRRTTGIDNVIVDTVAFLGGDRSRALISFAEPDVAMSLIEKSFIEFKQHKYCISKPSGNDSAEAVGDEDEDQKETWKQDQRQEEKVDLEKELEEENERRRTVIVSNVPVDKVETVLCVLESRRKGGGPVKSSNMDGNSGTLLVTFIDEEVASKFIEQGSVQLSNITLSISQFNGRIRDFPQSIGIPDSNVVTKTNTDVDGIEPAVNRPVVEAGPESPDARVKLNESTVDNSSELLSTSIELSNIPAGLTESTLTTLLESRRIIGIKDAQVVSVQYIADDHSKAIVTYSDSAVAESLIVKETIQFKETIMYITRHIKVSATSDTDLRVNVGNALPIPLKVSNIPVGMSENNFLVIMENKQYGGGDIKEVKFDEVERSAVVQFIDPTVAESLITKETVKFKGKTMFVTRHFESSAVVDQEKELVTYTTACSTTGTADEVNGVKVSSIPAGMTETNFLMVMENKRYGGGDIKEVKFDDDSRSAVVQFVDPTVAESLIAKETVKFREDIMYVTRHFESSAVADQARWSSATTTTSTTDATTNAGAVGAGVNGEDITVKIRNIPAGMTETNFLMVMENKRYNGGDIKEVKFDDASRSALVQFVDPTVAESLITKETVNFKGNTMYVTRHFESTADEAKESRTGTSTTTCSATAAIGTATTGAAAAGGTTDTADKDFVVKVSNIPAGMTENNFLMLMENKRYGGGGEVKIMKFDVVEKSAVVQFLDPTAGKSLLAKGTVTFKSQTLTVSQFPTATPTATEQQQSSSCSNTIKVTNIPESVSRDMLVMYFENKRRCGGGEVKDLQLIPDKHKAVITFCNPDDAQRVAQRPHTVAGAALNVTSLESQPDVSVCAIEVSGITREHTSDLISLFFENKKRSGGGPISDIITDYDNGVAVITFDEAAVVGSVLKHGKHSLSGTEVAVKAMQPAPPPSLVLDADVDAKRLLAKRLPVGCSLEQLQTFLNRAPAPKLTCWTIGIKPSTALLDFIAEPDYSSLRRLVVSRPFRGKMISIQKVARTSSIVVLGVPDNVTDDFITLYFENASRSGGGEVTSLQRLEDNKNNVIVTFADANVIPNVLSHTHTVGGKIVKVQPYYKWLGIEGDSGERKPSSNGGGRVPPPERMSVDRAVPPAEGNPARSLSITCLPAVFNYITKTPVVKKEIEMELEKQNCIVAWPQAQDQPIELRFKTSSSRQNPDRNWSEKCKSMMESLLSGVVYLKMNILQELWNDFKKQMEESIRQKHFEVIHKFDDDHCDVHFVGKKMAVEAFEQAVNSVKSNLEKELSKKNENISESPPMKPHLSMLLYVGQYNKEIEKTFQNVTVTAVVNEFNLRGSTEDINQVKMKIYEKLATVVSNAMNVTRTKKDLMKKDEMREHLISCFGSNRVIASWEVRDTEVIVYAYTEEAVTKACEIIRSEMCETQVPLEGASSQSLLSQPKWREFLNKLTQDNKPLVVDTSENGKIIVLSTKNCSENVMKMLLEFIDRNSLEQELVPMMPVYVELLTRCMADRLKQIERPLAESGGSLKTSVDPQNSGFILMGSKTMAGGAAKKLNDLACSIMPYDHDIDRPGVPEYLFGGQGNAVLQTAKRKYRVAFELENGTDEPGQPDLLPEAKFKRQISKDKRVLLLVADITKHKVDAIVTLSANNLQNFEGVAKLICDAAGQEIFESSRMHYKENGELLPGQSYLSEAGRLPSKYLIYAVGPKYRANDQKRIGELYEAVTNALIDAADKLCRNVSIPARGADIYGFPLDVAMETMLSAVRDFLSDENVLSVCEVHIIDSDNEVITKFGSHLMAMNLMSEPHNEDPTPPTPAQLPRHAKRLDRPDSQSPDVARGAGPMSPGARFRLTDKPNVLQTAEGIDVSLVKGSIVTQKVDCIVNTTGKDLNLTHGAVSKSLLEVAGPEMQAECTKNKTAQFNYGEIVETKGYKLLASCVYHTACAGWDSGSGGCEQVIRKLLHNVLQRAHASRLKSIALPAIGTGNLRVPHRLVTDIMYDEIEAFSRQLPGTSLKDIRIVVYDKDAATIVAFEAKIKELTSPGGSRQARPVGASAGAAAAAAAGPTGGMAVSPQLAAQISYDASSKTFTAGPVKMEVREGDITRETVDAIVNSTNDKLTAQGAVSKAILRAGGDALISDCKKVRMGANGLCVTTGGNLHAQYVIHLNAPHHGSWKPIVMNCLAEAERLKLKTIAFPLLGTGNIGLPVKDVANFMLECVTEFASRGPVHLRLIRVCIFQQQMVQEFADTVASRTAAGWAQKAVGASPALPGSGGSRPPAEESVKPHLRKCVVHIYGLSKKDIDDFIDDIEKMIRDYLVDKVMDTPQDQDFISKLTDDQIKRIKNIEKVIPVQITLEKGQRINRIRVRGPPKVVMTAVDEIHNIFIDVKQQQHQKFVGKQAQWEYLDNNDYEKYPDEINVIIENAYSEKKPHAEWEEQEARYRLTFATMEEEMVGDATSKVKVRRNAKEIDVPAHWMPMVPGEPFKRVALDPTSDEYKTVEENVKKTCHTTCKQIIQIERIQNPSLYKQYFVRKSEMEKMNPTAQNERILWHGTSADTVHSINSTAFNRSYCGKNATMYGRGVYFARDFSYSGSDTYSPRDANGVKYVYQTLVLTGEFQAGASSMIVPPAKPSGGRYDCVVDNVASPTIFVVFYDTQAYPQYLVSFK